MKTQGPESWWGGGGGGGRGLGEVKNLAYLQCAKRESELIRL